MLTLAIHYLTGCAAGSEPDAHERPEWPPHPGRVFLALAEACFTGDGDADERAALEWLEALDQAPAISASEAYPRIGTNSKSLEYFVPVNDKPIWKKDPAKKDKRPPAPLQSVDGIMRDRKERAFARATLDNEYVHFTWPDASPSPAIRSALARLTSRVARLGHSSSLVQCWLPKDNEELPAPTWLPDEARATRSLRLASPGTLPDLERRYNAEAITAYHELLLTAREPGPKKAQNAAKKQLKEHYPDGPPPRERPALARYQGYAPAQACADPQAPGTHFDPNLLVLGLERRDGPLRSLDLRDGPALVSRWREALISRSNGESPALRSLISGHDDAGAPLQVPHLALAPLGFVGHPHADGHLLGVACIFPRSTKPELRRQALRCLAQVSEIRLGRLGCWRVVSQGLAPQAQTLAPATWTAAPKGATHWASISPIVFDRHPKAKDRAAYQREAAQLISAACTRAGLPEPTSVIITPVSAHLGAPPAHAFPRLQRKDGSQRRHAHAIIVFDQPIVGPLLLGAGRYRGYGLCRPLDAEGG